MKTKAVTSGLLAVAAAVASAPVASAEVTATKYPYIDYRTFAKRWETPNGRTVTCTINTILTVQSPTKVITGAKSRCSTTIPYPPRLAVSVRRNTETVFNDTRVMSLFPENGTLTWGTSFGPSYDIAAARYQVSAVILDPAGRWELFGNSEVVKTSASVK